MALLWGLTTPACSLHVPIAHPPLPAYTGAAFLAIPGIALGCPRTHRSHSAKNREYSSGHIERRGSLEKPSTYYTQEHPRAGQTVVTGSDVQLLSKWQRLETQSVPPSVLRHKAHVLCLQITSSHPHSHQENYVLSQERKSLLTH